MDASVEALDIRLRRLEYALTGSASSTGKSDKSDSLAGNIPSQISALNERLTRIANQNKSIKKLLQACDSNPSLLEDSSKQSQSAPSTLTQSEKLAIILPSAPLYHQTSSLLLAIRDTPFPEESVSAGIANSLPEVVKLQLAVAQRDEHVENLAKRSLAVLQGWYEIVEGFNGCVAEWDERLRDLETKVWRKEKIMRDADEY